MSAAKNTTKSTETVEDTKLKTVPSQAGDPQETPQQADEKSSVVAKAKSFVVTNKKSILGAVGAVAAVALVAVAKSKRDAKLEVVEDSELDAA